MKVLRRITKNQKISVKCLLMSSLNRNHSRKISIICFILFMFVLLISWNPLCWNRPLRWSSPTIIQVLTSPPFSHATTCLIYKSFHLSPGIGTSPHPEQPIPVLDNLFSREFFLLSNRNLTQHTSRPFPLIQSLVTWGSDWRLPHFQVVITSNKTPPEHPSPE